MMERCPKCGASTHPYQGVGGAPPSSSTPRTPAVAASSGGRSQSNQTATTPVGGGGRGKVFAQHQEVQPPTTPLHTELDALHAALRAKELEVQSLRMEAQQQPRTTATAPAAQRTVGSGDRDAVSTHGELTAAWSQHVNQHELQLQLVGVREKYNALLQEKDRWIAESLRHQEEHHEAIAKLEEQYRDARNDAQRWQVKCSEQELQISDMQRKHFESEQHVHLYAQKMQTATDEVRDLQRAVASSKEADRRDLERARTEVAAHARRLAEVEDALKHARLRMADMKDELESSTSVRSSVSQKHAAAVAERDQLEEAKLSLERQLNLSNVEHHALAQEARHLRELHLESTARIETLEGQKRELAATLEELRETRQREAASGSVSSEVKVLRHQLETATSEAAQATHERAAAVQAAEALRTEVRRLDAANHALDDEVHRARQSNDVLAKELGTLRTEIKSIGMEFQAAQASQLEAYQKHCDDLRQENQRSEEARRKLADQLERQSREADVMRAAHDQTRLELKQSAHALQQALDEAANELRKANAELDRKQSLSPTKVAHEATLLHDRIADLQASLAQSQQTLQTAQRQLDANRLELEEAHRASAADKAVTQRHQALLDDILREAGQICTRDELPVAVRAFVRERNMALEEKEATAARANADVAKLRDEVDHLRSEVQRLDHAATRAHERASAAEQELRRHERASETALSDLAHNAQQQAQRSMDALTEKLSRQERDLHNMQHGLEGVQALHAAAEERLKSVDAERSRAVESLRLAREELDAKQRVVERHTTREMELVASVRQMQQQLDAQQSMEGTLQHQLEALRGDNAKLRRDTDAAAQLLARALEEDRRLQDADRDRLQRDLEQCRLQIKMERDRRAMEADVSRTAESRCQELETQLAAAVQERDHFGRECTAMRQSHKATVDAYDARVRDLEAQSSEFEQQVKDLAQRLLQSDQSMRAAQDACDAATAQLAQLHSEKDLALRRMDDYATSRQRHAHRDGASPAVGRSGVHDAHRPVSPAVERQPGGLSGGSRLRSPTRGSEGAGSVQDLRGYDAHKHSGPSSHDGLPPQQSPIPQPTLSGSSRAGVTSSGLSARERNDALLAQFREQRALSSGGSVPGPRGTTPSLRAVADGSTTLSTGFRLGSLRR